MTSVAVVGDGAVGLCAVLAAKRLGRTRIIAMSRHPDRQALAREFGATDIVEERGDEGVARCRSSPAASAPTGCSSASARRSRWTRRSARRAPAAWSATSACRTAAPSCPCGTLFDRNVGVNGGVAPVRGYIEELLPDVLSGAIEPGRVFDLELPLTEAAEAYAAMDERRAIKVLLRP